MIQKITIDDGTREIPFYNQFDEKICTIRFRPADISIMDRFNAMQASLPDIFKPLEGVDLKADGTTENEQGWDTLKQVEAGLIEQLNTLLDTTTAADIFKTRNPFSAVGGKFFCERVITALGELIADAVAEETAKTQERVEKYMPTEDEQDDRTATDKPAHRAGK